MLADAYRRNRRPRVWLVFHANAHHQHPDPAVELEGYPSLKVALFELGSRMRTGSGSTLYVHPDRQDGKPFTRWPDHDATCSVSAWLAWEMFSGHAPDATSTPHERWTLGPNGGVIRTRY